MIDSEVPLLFSKCLIINFSSCLKVSKLVLCKVYGKKIVGYRNLNRLPIGVLVVKEYARFTSL